MGKLACIIVFCLLSTGAFSGPEPGSPAPEPRFSALEDRAVRDNLTGLDWWPALDIDVTWHDAARWAEYAAIDFGGRWRMPTVEELQTLCVPDLGPHNISPLFQITAFTVWADAQKGSQSAWCFDFDGKKGTWAARHRSLKKRAFAVRESQPPT